MTFYWHTYKNFFKLFWLNGITIEQKLKSSTIILNEKNINKRTIAYLPTKTNSETFSAITGQKYEPTSNEVIYNQVIELRIVKWLVSKNEYQWYIGYSKQKVENSFVIDHLHCYWPFTVTEKTNIQSSYPFSEYSNSREITSFTM